ncbi:MAG: PAS domain-containing protein [Cyclobacteriaceae bacterium]
MSLLFFGFIGYLGFSIFSQKKLENRKIALQKHIRTSEVSEVIGWGYDLESETLSWSGKASSTIRPITDCTSWATFSELIRPVDRSTFDAATDQCKAHHDAFDEDIWLDFNPPICIRIKGQWMTDSHEQIIYGSVQEITGNKKLELTLLKNNAYLKTFYETQKVISRSENKWTLSAAISKILMDELRYDWIWIGFADIRDSTPSKVVSNIFDKEKFEENGPFNKVVQTKEPFIIKSIAAHNEHTEWVKHALNNGFSAYCSLPILHNDMLYGTLNIYSGSRDQFETERVYFLNRIANEIGHWVHTSQIEQEREELNEFNHLLISSLQAVLLTIDFPNDQLSFSGPTEQVLGIAPGSMTTVDQLMRNLHPYDLRDIESRFSGQLGEGFYDMEYRFKGHSNVYRWVRAMGRVYTNDKGDIVKVIGIITNINQKKNEEKRLADAQIKGQDNERKRISKELHDSLGQTLSVASMSMGGLKQGLSEDSNIQELHKLICEMIEKAKTETREISHNLMPTSLVDFGLIASIRADVNRLNASGKISCLFETNLTSERFDFSIESNLYNIFREATNNALKHARASQVRIQLIRLEENSIKLTIHDNGKGLPKDPTMIKEGIGMGSIRSRVHNIEGDLVLKNDNGLKISIYLTPEINA